MAEDEGVRQAAEPAGAEPRLGGGAEAGSAGRGKQHRSRAERERLIAAYRASGQSAQSFCAEQGIRPTTFSSWLRAERGGAATGRRGRRKTYRPEERRAAVEGFYRSGRTLEDFAKLWGVTPWTLGSWVRRYEAEGPKGLEDRPRGRRGPRPEDPRRLPWAVREEITRTKRRFPDFGMRKVRDFLLRFHGIRVSANSVQKTLREAGIAPLAPPKRRPRRKARPAQRFERARPGELWQTDITSYVLRRHGRRVYLVVFLDDCSRYVVSHALATQQRGELVCEALLEGIARFGKPREVLSDQGRQYFAWRGKSGFQRLLAREGIAHVVSRTHHPQTLGKCERLWKTIGEELWDRARPEDLVEARERLAHYLRHYNHFRPHQGIGGLVPADRFFGAESALRRTLEAEMRPDELALALEERARRAVYLFGQVGDHQVALHGERGRLVLTTSEGERREIGMDELGMGQEEHGDGRARDEQRDDRRHEQRDAAAAAETGGTQAGALLELPAAGPAGAGAVAGGDERGEGDGARDLHGDPGVLARPGEPGGDGGAAVGAAAAGVAALAAGAVGDAGGPVAPAADAAQGGAAAGAAGGGSERAAPADRGARADAAVHRGPRAGAAGAALEPTREGGEGGWQPPQRFGEGIYERATPARAPEGHGRGSSDGRSGSGSAEPGSPPRSEPAWPRGTA